MLEIGWTCHMIGSPVLALPQPRQARLGRCEWNHLGIDCGGSRAKRVGGKKKSPDRAKQPGAEVESLG